MEEGGDTAKMNININKEIERLDRHYRIFISSTYEDLKEFRFSALQAILDSECVPLGMEMFPSNDEEQLTYIKRIIDKCDFYLILVGGRYGSRAKSGKSFTEEEFEYARSKNKKIIALVLDGKEYDKTFKKQSESEQISIINFRKLVRSERIANSFENNDQLKYEVSKSIREAAKFGEPDLGLVSSREVMNVIESFSDLDDEEKIQYFDALNHLQNLTNDGIAWSFISNSFDSLKQATHSLVYEGTANLHKAPLLNSLIGLQRFIEEVMYVPVRISVKETLVSGSSVKLRTICDTKANRRKKAHHLSKYEGLSFLYKQIWNGDYEEYWMCHDIPSAISNNEFGMGSFSAEKYQQLQKSSEDIPFESTLCLPIYNIDMFDGDKPIIRGFLCMDAKEKNQFQHDAILEVAASYCSYLYIFLAVRSYFKRDAEGLNKIIFSKKLIA